MNIVVAENSARKRNKITLATKGAIAGYLFISPFIIGFLAFMARPMIQSIRMVFSQVHLNIQYNRFDLEFTRLVNLNRALLVHPAYTRYVTEEVTRMGVMIPAVLIFSFFIAVLLNNAFPGRAFVRAVFFLPVILASGVLVDLETSNSMLNQLADHIRESNALRANITGVLEDILMSATGAAAVNDFMEYIFLIINQIHTIAMASGIQILIFLSGLQTIPKSVYEASSIEGATAWENFWKITFPMLSPMILVVVVYTVVDFLVRTDNRVMNLARQNMLQGMEYGLASAMVWVYFLVVALILAIVCGLISRVVYYYD
ncbi:MAG: sugar ABC transporter permease [Firmicutes bacterium]|nr:sugar ABC transporter permease [Bacillota bacterium]